ncbi:MAG: PASTA domain-containing protein [Clostridiales Family XIII bacterium]|jgi:stage V sporulation protein D (sporulation-specific penicillin-binding protein)|nr:PASTA domain-containing protein [Clostridiales Family XIII bacterium]
MVKKERRKKTAGIRLWEWIGSQFRKDMNIRTQGRLIFTFVAISCCFVALICRVGWIAVVESDTYAAEAAERQTKDVMIPAHRGGILDRNMKGLAVSAVSYRVWVRPAGFGVREKKSGVSKLPEGLMVAFAQQLGMDEEALRGLVSQDKQRVRIARDVSKDAKDGLDAWIKENKIAGVEFEDDVSRYYPYGPFAAHVLGSVNDDGYGRGGIEMKYDQYLTGISGRWIKKTDRYGDIIAYGTEKHYEEKNGMNVVLTIDEAIQHYVEKAIGNVAETTSAQRVMCIVMDPRNGDILAMGMTPDYDPNDPRVPLDPAEAEYVGGLPPNEQVQHWNKMWRNPMVSDVYDPGSTFKLITVSAALEERVVTPTDSFRCTGYYQVGNNSLRCWRYYDPHGAETLTEAVGNSCNPVMIQLAQRMGFDTFYDYIERFGITSKTEIDYPGEGSALLQSKESAGQVGLATMSFGQGLSVTPIQLITAVSALGNGGMLMQPRLVKAVADKDGQLIEEFEPQAVRQVVSEQTAAEMMKIMEFVVAESGGKVASVPGYRIGGKTGTAEKLDNGSYKTGKVTGSMVAMAPMEDPQIAVLLIVDEPQGIKFGSTTAGPGIKEIMVNVLRHMNIMPSYTQEALAKMQSSYVTVPELKSMNFSDAAGLLLGSELMYAVSPEGSEEEDFMVVDQYPKAGERLPKGGTVFLYR